MCKALRQEYNDTFGRSGPGGWGRMSKVQGSRIQRHRGDGEADRSKNIAAQKKRTFISLSVEGAGAGMTG